jgi:hypothetical protein
LVFSVSLFLVGGAQNRATQADAVHKLAKIEMDGSENRDASIRQAREQPSAQGSQLVRAT